MISFSKSHLRRVLAKSKFAQIDSVRARNPMCVLVLGHAILKPGRVSIRFE